ncbi:MAG TPA: ABC transporter substrate-binding protein [Anaerolineales bacterium]|nr:ABC transporter substrate-binding protein [Anaerolineales bacterium]
MKRFRWQILIVLLALVAIGVLLLGQQPTLQPIVPEVKPATGGIYTEALVGSLERLNPVLDFYNPPDRDLDYLLFSGLLRFDARGLPQNDLVESMGISQDGKNYNFSLRQDAVFHDGTPLTSEDVVFTIDLMRDEKIPVPDDVRALWNDIEVEALNEYTLQFRLPEPYAPFPDYLTFGILPKHLLGNLDPEEIINASFNMDPIGSGPYRFDHLIVENGKISGISLVSFDKYYQEPPFIEQMLFRYYPDSESALAAYQAGEVEGISQVSSKALQSALKEPDLNLYTGRLPQLSMILFNLGNTELPFFQESDIRRALLMGLSRQRMIDNLMAGQGIIADGPIFPGTWAYYDGIERVPYDPEAAVSALKEAGYIIPASGGSVRAKENQSLSFDLVYPDDPEHAALAEAIQADWSRIGVGVELKPVSYEDLVSDYLEPRIFQAALLDINLARSPDPDPYPFWHQSQTTGGQNYAKWDDRQASEYLEQARVTWDVAERTRLYRNFQVRFVNEMPALPLYYPVYTYAVDGRVQGVTMGPLFDTGDRFATVTSWFLVAKTSGQETPVPGGSEPVGTYAPTVTP